MLLKSRIAVVFACAIAVALAGCAVPKATVSFYGKPANFSGGPLHEIQVSFDPALPKPFVRGVAVGFYPGVSPTRDVPAMVPAANRSAARDGPRLAQVFSNGFQNRFSAIAASHGLTVKPNAPQVMQVRITTFDETCWDSGCEAQLWLDGEIVDAAGRKVWTFGFFAHKPVMISTAPDDLFDKFAADLFKAMKKEGLVES